MPRLGCCALAAVQFPQELRSPMSPSTAYDYDDYDNDAPLVPYGEIDLAKGEGR